MKAQWVRVGVYVICVDAEGRVLLTRIRQAGNPDTGGWTLPGGGMEWGEQPVDTAHREVIEETGYRVELGPLLAVTARWFEASETMFGVAGQAVGLLYPATVIGGELLDSFDPDESTDAAAWFTLTEIENLRAVPLVAFALEAWANLQHTAQDR